MSMQNIPNNPIEVRKQAVRTYTTRGAVEVVGGVLGGISLALLFSSWTWLVIGLVVAVVGGGVNYNRVRRIIDYRDPQ